MSGTSPRGRLCGEDGAGLMATMAGVSVFLAFLLFAVQLLYSLYATSVVTSIASDAARSVASSDQPRSAVLSADALVRQRLGTRCETDCLTWRFDPPGGDPATVHLRVRVDNPSMLPVALSGRLGFDSVDRTVTARVEGFR